VDETRHKTHSSQPAFHSSGSADIDAVRREVKVAPSNADNHRRRALLLYMWLSALQQQGADTRPFTDVDKRYYSLADRLATEDDERLLAELTALVDEGFDVMETIQSRLVERGPIATPSAGDASDFPEGGDMEAEWPLFQGDVHHTGYTKAPGPRFGRGAWKFPVGLGWYARPVVERGKVYVASPGMHSTSFCLDLKTGREIWKSSQDHPLFGIYKYPAIASTPLVLDDRIVLREVNSHGGNEGQAKNLVYLDKTTGKTFARKYAGHVDYRTQYAAMATNGKYMVYPFGVHDIYGTPAICQNFNRLICADIDNDNWLWDFNVGDIDALAEPVVTQDLALVGTMEGYLYALRLAQNEVDAAGEFLPANKASRVVWKFKTSGAVNTQVALANGRVFFGCNGGSVYCLDEKTGTLIWQRSVDEVEHRARKHFSTPLVHGDRVYVGAANRRVYALDAETGVIVWQAEASDWVRAKPVICGDFIFAATIDGKLHCFDSAGALTWSKTISTHPIYADIVLAEDRLLISDSNIMLYCLSADGRVLWEKSTLEAFVDDSGQRIFTDELSGGTYYQSKPTAHRGKIFFGTPSGFLHAADAETGEEIWKFEMGAAISAGPACADGRVFAGQQGGERFFYCVDAEDGALIWKQTLPGGWVWGSATVDDGLVYVPTVSGYAVCLDAQTGHIVWMFPTAQSIPAEPAIDGDLVYFGSWSRSIYAFHKKTGEIAWKTNGIALDSGTLIAFDRKVYLPHHSNIFKYLDGQTGGILNEGNSNAEKKGAFSDFNATPAFHDGRAFFSARGGMGLRGVPLFSTVYCVDPETAKIYWTFPDGGGLSAPALASDRVYIASGNSPFLYCLDEETGKMLWTYKLGHRVEEATLCIYRDKVFALAADGYVHAIE